jgi:hypothetical protein
MIPKTTIDQYLDVKKDSHLWLKDISERELDRALASLHPRPRFAANLWFHQKVCFLLGVAYPRFLDWVDMGGGKTSIALELIRYWKQAGRLRSAFVFVPTEPAIYSWETELAKWKFGLNHVALDTGSSKGNWRVLEENETDLVLATYPAMVAMLCDKPKEGKWKPGIELVERFVKGKQGSIFDEVTHAGFTTSLTHRLCARIGASTPISYGLAGLPFGRDPMILYGQYRVVDQGETFGRTLGLFREAFFAKRKNYFAKGSHTFDYSFKKKLQPELRRMMRHRSVAFASKEFTNVPPVVAKVVKVGFPEETAAYYQKAVAKFRASRGNFTELNSSFVRMRQISSGFVGFRDDETGERAQVEFAHNPKRDELLEWVAELPDDSKAVIFYEFTLSGRRISEALTKLGHRNVWLWSKTKTPRDKQRQFDVEPDLRFMVVNHMLGAEALNLQVANYLWVYESPVGVIARKQMERRVDRPGQTKTVFMSDLVTRGTVDERILEFHREGEDLKKVLMRDPGRLI